METVLQLIQDLTVIIGLLDTGLIPTFNIINQKNLPLFQSMLVHTKEPYHTYHLQ